MPHDFDRIEEALLALAEGRPVIVVDHEDRENEGDFVAAAEKVTPELLEFMMTQGRGQLCMAILPELAQKLDLPPMIRSNFPASRAGMMPSLAVGTNSALTFMSCAKRLATSIS